MRRFIDMATVRAVIMQRRIRRSFPVPGQPLAARKAERRAKGRAKRVWESLMSLARVESFWPRPDLPRRHEDTKALSVGGDGTVAEVESVPEVIVVVLGGGWRRKPLCDEPRDP